MGRFFGILLVVLIVLGVALTMAGILRFENSADQSTITIDKRELKQQTEETVDATRQAGGAALEKTGQTLRRAGEGLQDATDDESTPQEAPASRPADADEPPRPHDSGR